VTHTYNRTFVLDGVADGVLDDQPKVNSSWLAACEHLRVFARHRSSAGSVSSSWLKRPVAKEFMASQVGTFFIPAPSGVRCALVSDEPPPAAPTALRRVTTQPPPCTAAVNLDGRDHDECEVERYVDRRGTVEEEHPKPLPRVLVLCYCTARRMEGPQMAMSQ
jgi:hypothetical protein